MAKKRGRKRTSNLYFGPEQETAIMWRDRNAGAREINP